MWRNIVDAEVNDVAPTELAVYREVEERQIPRPPCELQARPNSPNVLWLKRWLRPDQFAFVPGFVSSLNAFPSVDCLHDLSPVSMKEDDHAVNDDAASR